MHEARLIIAPNLRYKIAWDIQNDLHERRKRHEISDVLILTEHPPVYTLGKNAHREHLLISREEVAARDIDLFHIDRGGDITFHGPGQLVGYPIFNLNDYYRDVGRFMRELEEVLIQALATFGITAGRNPGYTGVWVGDAKIAAIGIKLSRWVTKHGFALNVHTDLRYFRDIVPCGIRNKPVTSLQELIGRAISLQEVIPSVISSFERVFEIQFTAAKLEEFMGSTELCLQD